MRELKFRAWDKEEKKYWYNVYSIANEENLYILEQYTGLKDKNGKEIYEGDIIGFSNKEHPNIEYPNLEVYYETDHCRFSVNQNVQGVDKKGRSLGGYRIEDFIEVIGNIHQNPELLK